MSRSVKARVRIRADISARELRQKARLSRQRNAVRLRALARVAEGDDYCVVAEACDVSLATIYYWIKRFNERGLDVFDVPMRRGRPSIYQLPIDLTQDMIDAVAPETMRASQRLLAISMLLANQRPYEVARQLSVSSGTITCWIKRASEEGIHGLAKGRRRPHRISIEMRDDITSRRLRHAATIAMRRKQVRAARRLTAVAFVLDGMKLNDVAGYMGISRSTVSRWSQAFNEKGIEGLFLRLDQKIAAKR